MVLGSGGIRPANPVRQEGNDLFVYNQGTKVGQIDSNGNLIITGDFTAGETFT